MNLIDTALAYGEGRSERLVGEVVRRRPEMIHEATKVPPKNLTWPGERPREVHVQRAGGRERSLQARNRLMRALIWAGWLMVALGAAMLAGSIAARSALFGVLTPATLAGTGVFMILLARGWDRPLASLGV